MIKGDVFAICAVARRDADDMKAPWCVPWLGRVGGLRRVDLHRRGFPLIRRVEGLAWPRNVIGSVVFEAYPTPLPALTCEQ